MVYGLWVMRWLGVNQRFRRVASGEDGRVLFAGVAKLLGFGGEGLGFRV